jgi:glycosyltransferase involved in cell wall biosynthesis
MTAPLQLDVVIPTYNRQDLLPRALESLLKAEVPPNLTVKITVVDNNSTDGTKALTLDFQQRHPNRVNYVFEAKQGRSHALNAGITATSGDLVGMIDDDEEIDGSWYSKVYNAFTQYEIDFLGGPYVPRWGAPPPAWLPPKHSGIIGVAASGDTAHFFGERPGDFLMGGNAVLSRKVLQKVGLYATNLGRTGTRLLADEDTDMFQRLLASGARGLYLPDLVIYHYIPPERLTKKYHRRWSFWRGVSTGRLDLQQPKPVPYLAGAPRYFFGAALRGVGRTLRSLLSGRKNPGQMFSDELLWWTLSGFYYGKYYYRSSKD